MKIIPSTSKYALELFSGTKSFGNIAKKYNYSVISLDIEKKHDPTIVADILDWDYKKFPVGLFDIIWASPDCRFYSTMQYVWVGKTQTLEQLEEKRLFSDKLVKKTLEIIDYFKPRLWYIENPFSGCLKFRPFMKDLPFCVGDYCMYSDWGYQKPTIFFTNRPVQLYRCKKDCSSIVVDEDGKKYHKTSMGGGHAKRRKRDHEIYGYSTTNTKLIERYRIPEKILKHLVFT